MINSKGEIMQNVEQTNPEMGVLTDAELDRIAEALDKLVSSH